MTQAAAEAFHPAEHWTKLSVVACSAVAVLVLLTGPILVGAYVTTLGLSEQLAGLMFSLEMLGFTTGAITMFAALSRDRRHIVVLALLAMVCGNVLSMFSEVIVVLGACRFLAGTGSGLLMTVTIVVIGSLRNPDSVYGLWTVGQLLLGAVGMIVFPAVIGSSGLPAVFAIIAVLSAMLFATAQFYPGKPETDGVPDSMREPSPGPWIGLICLAGIFVYYAGQTGVWVYLERIGVTWNLQPGNIALVLFGGLFAGVVGATIAVILGGRVGRKIPVVTSMTISALSIVLLVAPGALTRFAVAACLFNLGWYLFLPYSAAVVASVDRDGKLLTGLSVVFPASLAAGPAFAALFVSGGELLGPLVIGLLSIPIGLAGILPATRRT